MLVLAWRWSHSVCTCQLPFDIRILWWSEYQKNYGGSLSVTLELWIGVCWWLMGSSIILRSRPGRKLPDHSLSTPSRLYGQGCLIVSREIGTILGRNGCVKHCPIAMNQNKKTHPSFKHVGVDGSPHPRTRHHLHGPPDPLQRQLPPHFGKEE